MIAAPSADPRLKVLHVITGLGRGGAETVLYRLAMHSSGMEHEVICLEGPEWYSSRLEERGVRVHHLNWTSARSTFSGAVRLRRLIRESRADLVQAWMYRANLLAGIAARGSGKAVVWNIRCSSLEPLRPASRMAAYLGGALARWLPDFIINCSAQSTILHARIGYDAVEGAVIPNGYDPELFHPDEAARSATRKALGLEAETFAVGTICRWHEQKGIPVLIEALGRLRREGITPRLLMIGKGLDKGNAELTRLIADSGCGEQIVPIGERSDIPDVARALDLHVLASIGSEGFPNVVAETMLSGTPNLATDIGDSALIVGDTGWVTPPHDPEALAAAIAEAYREWKSAPEEWQSRRGKARDRIAENFSLDRMVQSYEAVWNRVTAQSR